MMRLPYKLALLCGRLREKGPLRRERHELRGHCPAHEDRAPSLYIGVTEELRGLVHCAAGCSADAIMQALDMTTADLFYEQDPWVEVGPDFQIVQEDVPPEPGVFQAPNVPELRGG